MKQIRKLVCLAAGLMIMAFGQADPVRAQAGPVQVSNASGETIEVIAIDGETQTPLVTLAPGQSMVVPAAPGSALGFAANTPVNPWGNPTAIDPCVITGVNDNSANWNAQWSTVTIPIPSNYTCNDSDSNGCWVKINYVFTGGINDTTSWNAFLLGDPVRLVQ